MEHAVERRRSGAYEAAHRPPPARPVRGGGGAPGPLKVYCVEPRNFRELVQRLTGAEAAAVPAPPMQRVVQAPAAISLNHGRAEASSAAAAAAAEQLDYASWFSGPLLSPAYAQAGFDGGHHGSGALL